METSATLPHLIEKTRTNPFTYLRQGEVNYPARLMDYLGEQAPPTVALWGARGLFKHKRAAAGPVLLYQSTSQHSPVSA